MRLVWFISLNFDKMPPTRPAKLPTAAKLNMKLSMDKSLFSTLCINTAYAKPSRKIVINTGNSVLIRITDMIICSKDFC